MTNLEEEFLKSSMRPEDVTDPHLFLMKLYANETHDDRAEVLAMIIKP